VGASVEGSAFRGSDVLQSPDMLLLLQGVAQQLPPINVTVQSPPGMPIWLSAPISAAIGAMFAVVTNVVMEFVKPKINQRVLHRMMREHIDTEFKKNMALVYKGFRTFELLGDNAEQITGDAKQVVLFGLLFLKCPKFSYYRNLQPIVVSEIDPEDHLAVFNESVVGWREMIEERELYSSFEGSVRIVVSLLKQYGEGYLASSGLQISMNPEDHWAGYGKVMDDLFKAVPPPEKRVS